MTDLICLHGDRMEAELAAEIAELRKQLADANTRAERANSKADQYVADWMAAKYDFGTAAARFREEIRQLRSRAEVAEAEANRAVLLLADLAEHHGPDHDESCPGDDTCDCGERERWAWLTTERVCKAREASQ